MTLDELEETFRDWWNESFPLAPPNPRTVDSHVAFAAFVLELKETLEEYGIDS